VAVVRVGGRENDGDGEEAEEEKKNNADGGRLYRAPKTTSRRYAMVLAKPHRAEDGLECSWKMAEGLRRRAGGGALWLETDFDIFTKMPLTQIYKLLSNFL
jgi:hypothetical protein